MPAIVDPDGPGGRPISVFESGAILQYLGRKTGKFYPRDERARVAVDEWLFWQMGGLGPMAGQAVHFRRYAPEQIRLCDRALHRRGQPALRRHEQTAGGARISGRPLFDRRHGLRRLGAACRAAGPGSRAVSASQALVRNDPRAAGGQARLRHPHRGGVRGRYATIRKCARSCSASGRGDDEFIRRSKISARVVISRASRSAICRTMLITQPLSSAVFGAGHGEGAGIGLAVRGVVDVAGPLIGRPLGFMPSTIGTPSSGRLCLLASALFLSVFGWPVAGSFGSLSQTSAPHSAPPQLVMRTWLSLSAVIPGAQRIGGERRRDAGPRQ